MLLTREFIVSRLAAKWKLILYNFDVIASRLSASERQRQRNPKEQMALFMSLNINIFCLCFVLQI